MADESNKIGEAFVEIRAKLDQLGKDLGSAEQQTRASTQRMQQHFSGLQNFLSGFGNAAAPSFLKLTSAVAAGELAFRALSSAVHGALVDLPRFVTHTLASVAAIGEQAAQLGLSTKAYQEYSFAAAQVGVSQEQLTSSVARLTRNIGEARAGVGPAAEAFRALAKATGSVIEVNKDTDTVLAQTISALGKLGDANDQAVASTALLGREGARLVNGFLAEGPGAIAKLRDEAHRLGVVLSEDTIRGAKEANDKLNVLEQVLRIKLAGTIAKLAPEIGRLADQLLNAIPNIAPQAEAWARSITTAVEKGIASAGAWVAWIQDHKAELEIGGALLAGSRFGVAGAAVAGGAATAHVLFGEGGPLRTPFDQAAGFLNKRGTGGATPVLPPQLGQTTVEENEAAAASTDKLTSAIERQSGAAAKGGKSFAEWLQGVHASGEAGKQLASTLASLTEEFTAKNAAAEAEIAIITEGIAKGQSYEEIQLRIGLAQKLAEAGIKGGAAAVQHLGAQFEALIPRLADAERLGKQAGEAFQFKFRLDEQLKVSEETLASVEAVVAAGGDELDIQKAIAVAVAEGKGAFLDAENAKHGVITNNAKAFGDEAAAIADVTQATQALNQAGTAHAAAGRDLAEQQQVLDILNAQAAGLLSQEEAEVAIAVAAVDRKDAEDGVTGALHDQNEADARLLVLAKQRVDFAKQLANLGPSIQQSLISAAQASDQAFVGFFEHAFQKGKFDFQALAQDILHIFERMLAEMAVQALIKPIIVQVFGTLGGALGLGGGGGGLGGTVGQVAGGLFGGGGGGGGGFGTLVNWGSTLFSVGSHVANAFNALSFDSLPAFGNSLSNAGATLFGFGGAASSATASISGLAGSGFGAGLTTIGGTGVVAGAPAFSVAGGQTLSGASQLAPIAGLSSATLAWAGIIVAAIIDLAVLIQAWLVNNQTGGRASRAFGGKFFEKADIPFFGHTGTYNADIAIAAIKQLSVEHPTAVPADTQYLGPRDIPAHLDPNAKDPTVLTRVTPHTPPNLAYVAAQEQYIKDQQISIGLTDKQISQFKALATGLIVLGPSGGGEGGTDTEILGQVATILGNISAHGLKAADAMNVLGKAVDNLGDPQILIQWLGDLYTTQFDPKLVARGQNGPLNLENYKQAVIGLSEVIFRDVVPGVHAGDLALQEFDKALGDLSDPTAEVNLEDIKKRIEDVTAAAKLMLPVFGKLEDALVLDASQFFKGGVISGDLIDPAALTSFHDAILEAMRDATIRGFTEAVLQSTFNAQILEPFTSTVTAAIAERQALPLDATPEEIAAADAKAKMAIHDAAVAAAASLRDLDPILREIILDAADLDKTFRDLEGSAGGAGSVSGEDQGKRLIGFGFNQGIQNQIAAFGDPIRLAFQQLDAMQAARLESAKAAGADLVEVEKLNGLERAQLIKNLGEQDRQQLESLEAQRQQIYDRAKEQAEQAIESIRAAIIAVTATTASPLAPKDAFANAQRHFAELVAKAQGGDIQAAQDLPQAFQDLLATARALYATGPKFADIFNAASAELNRIIDRGADAITRLTPGDQAIVDKIDAQTATLHADLQHIADLSAPGAAGQPPSAGQFGISSSGQTQLMAMLAGLAPGGQTEDVLRSIAKIPNAGKLAGYEPGSRIGQLRDMIQQLFPDVHTFAEFQAVVTALIAKIEDPGTFQPILGFAAGGLVRGATPAMLGEGGRTELILPLNAALRSLEVQQFFGGLIGGGAERAVAAALAQLVQAAAAGGGATTAAEVQQKLQQLVQSGAISAALLDTLRGLVATAGQVAKTEGMDIVQALTALLAALTTGPIVDTLHQMLGALRVLTTAATSGTGGGTGSGAGSVGGALGTGTGTDGTAGAGGAGGTGDADVPGGAGGFPGTWRQFGHPQPAGRLAYDRAGNASPLGVSGRFNTGTILPPSWLPGGRNAPYLRYAPRDAQGRYIYDQTFYVPGVGYRHIPRPQLDAPGTVYDSRATDVRRYGPDGTGSVFPSQPAAASFTDTTPVSAVGGSPGASVAGDTGDANAPGGAGRFPGTWRQFGHPQPAGRLAYDRAGNASPLGVSGRFNTGTILSPSWLPGGQNAPYLRYAPRDAQGWFIYDQTFYVPDVGYRHIPRPQLDAPGTVYSSRASDVRRYPSGTVPGFATGGIADREQLIRVGEGGHSELIVPFDPSRRSAETQATFRRLAREEWESTRGYATGGVVGGTDPSDVIRTDLRAAPLITRGWDATPSLQEVARTLHHVMPPIKPDIHLFSEATSAAGLATGGLVTRETFARLGEAGPEAVVPLATFTHMLEQRVPPLADALANYRMPSLPTFTIPSGLLADHANDERDRTQKEHVRQTMLGNRLLETLSERVGRLEEASHESVRHARLRRAGDSRATRTP